MSLKFKASMHPLKYNFVFHNVKYCPIYTRHVTRDKT